MRLERAFDGSLREDEPAFAISRAAELAGMHPQTLRQYDRLGLVSPQRTAGRGRRYSLRDISQLIEVQRLSHEGINLAGIKRILDLEAEVRQLQHRVDLLAAAADPGSRVFTAGASGDVVAVRRGQRFRRAWSREQRPTDGESGAGALVLWRPQR